MFTIAKSFEFSASHQLHGLAADHPCARQHGHNYIVEVELAADVLDDRGFVVDYRDLAPVKVFLDDEWDHRHLNDWFAGWAQSLGYERVPNPTAETMAFTVFALFGDIFPEMVAVRVRETPKTVAEYRP